MQHLIPPSKQVQLGAFGVLIVLSGLDNRGLSKWSGRLQETQTNPPATPTLKRYPTGTPYENLQIAWTGSHYRNGALTGSCMLATDDNYDTPAGYLRQVAGVVDLATASDEELGSLLSQFAHLTGTYRMVGGSILVRSEDEHIEWSCLTHEDLSETCGAAFRNSLQAKSSPQTRPAYDQLSAQVSPLLREGWGLNRVRVHPHLAEILCAEWCAGRLLVDFGLYPRHERAQPLYVAELPLVVEPGLEPDQAELLYAKKDGHGGWRNKSFITYVAPDWCLEPDTWCDLRSEGNSPEEAARILEMPIT